MLWIMLLTLHKKVEIVLAVSSTSQESKNNLSYWTKGSRSPDPVHDMYQSWVIWLFFNL